MALEFERKVKVIEENKNGKIVRYLVFENMGRFTKKRKLDSLVQTDKPKQSEQQK